MVIVSNSILLLNDCGRMSYQEIVNKTMVFLKTYAAQHPAKLCG
ncbi:hypothetical protein CRENPOLYSF1_920005 [Crenothrix polyspora]|uniref:Uncharacterized protein n=1 Tax=Crenothrix polyspora TaxID=360316 RepID=A0A1R4HJY9_9GAMM|nr:hypothetical protein CRENPOLYSF1_920005 [Crenothrix polyspora]